MASILPFITDFGLQPDPTDMLMEDQTAQNLVEAPPEALGVDIGLDPLYCELMLSADMDLVLVGEFRALKQWGFMALTVPQSASPLYSGRFGSELSELLGSGIPDQELRQEVGRIIRDALLVHDRIAEVRDVGVTVSQDTLYFTAKVILDDDAVLQFEGATSIG